MATTYYLNVNYVCNERCVFCAAGLANGPLKPAGHVPWVTLQEVKIWLAGNRPRPGDRVLLAGGEPTLHKELIPIVRLLADNCDDVMIFSNGLRLADPAYARETVEAGITHFQIPLYGASAHSHEAITRRPGSFACTLAALEVLSALRLRLRFKLELRLLVSRQCSIENPDIVRLVQRRAPRVDVMSLNRVLLSEDAEAADAGISYAEARPAINEAARLITAGGYELGFESLPLCVFEGDNAEVVRERTATRAAQPQTPAERLYLDPFVAASEPLASSLAMRRVLPDTCLDCDYAWACDRVESWYVRRFGDAGLKTVRLSDSHTARAVAIPL